MAKKKKTRPSRVALSEKLASWLGERKRYLLLSLLVIYTLASALLFDPKPFVGGDNAAYVLLSKALATGQGLVELWTPGKDPHTQYPFGFPLLLTPISVLKLPYVWYKVVPWLFGLAGIILTWLLFHRRNIAIALAITILITVNIYFLEYGHRVLSELPFLAGLMLTLFLGQRWEETSRWPWFLGIVFSTAACLHLRSAGQALVAAVFLWLLFKRKYRWAGIFLISVIILMIPWTLRNMHYGTSGGYLDQFLMRDPYQPELGRVTFSEVILRVGTNLRLYLGSIWPQMMAPGSVSSIPSPLEWLWFLLISLPVLIGAVVAIQHRRTEGWLAICYLGLSVLWPVAWTDLRFSLPLLPVNLWLSFEGYRKLSNIFCKKSKTAVMAIVFFCLLALSLISLGKRAEANLGMLAGYLRGDRLSGYDPRWRSFFRAAEWMKNNSPQESIVISRKPQLFYLISGRTSFCYPFTTDPDSMMKSLIRADYVMVEPISGTLQRYLLPAIQPLINKRFQMVQAIGDPPTYVLRVIKEGGHDR